MLVHVLQTLVLSRQNSHFLLQLLLLLYLPRQLLEQLCQWVSKDPYLLSFGCLRLLIPLLLQNRLSLRGSLLLFHRVLVEFLLLLLQYFGDHFHVVLQLLQQGPYFVNLHSRVFLFDLVCIIIQSSLVVVVGRNHVRTVLGFLIQLIAGFRLGQTETPELRSRQHLFIGEYLIFIRSVKNSHTLIIRFIKIRTSYFITS